MFKTIPAFSSFSVDDIPRAKQFYTESLGLEVKEIPEGLELYLFGGAKVFIYHSTDYTAPEHTVLNFVVDNIEKTVDELIKHGVHLEQYAEPNFKTDAKGILRSQGEVGPYAIAWFKDPAGHILAVMQVKE